MTNRTCGRSSGRSSGIKIRDGTVSFLFASDGVEALTVLKANCDVDMVITDINMPRMDGLLLLQNLQESEEKLSTIIVSAYGDMANIRTAMNLECALDGGQLASWELTGAAGLSEDESHGQAPHP